jgi:glycosyltransferase involved in cell wall biosynthesis
MKRLLGVSWEMPPLTGPRATQVTRTMVALAGLGWLSRTVCFSPHSNRYQQDDDVRIEQLSGGAATLIPVRSPEEWFLVRALWRVLPPLKKFPDEKRVWMPGALRAARAALDAEPADVVVTFGQPWTDHLIGLTLKRERGLPWVAHFSDPWVDSPYFRAGSIARNRSMQWERDVIANADRVVFVSSYTRDRMMARYPAEWRAKTTVITQGFDDRARAIETPATEGRPVRLVYTGRFYDGIRSPEPLLHALDRVNRETPLAGRLEVIFVGGATDEYARLAASLTLGRIVTFTGRVSPNEALDAAARADVLLLIDAPSPSGPSLFLPSKLVDYLPMRRPIVGLTPAAGPSADLLNELGYPVIDPSDEAAIARLVTGLLEPSSATLRLSPNHDAVAHRYRIGEVAKAFAVVLDEACQAR